MKQSHFNHLWRCNIIILAQVRRVPLRPCLWKNWWWPSPALLDFDQVYLKVQSIELFPTAVPIWAFSYYPYWTTSVHCITSTTYWPLSKKIQIGTLPKIILFPRLDIFSRKYHISCKTYDTTRPSKSIVIIWYHLVQNLNWSLGEAIENLLQFKS